MENKWSKNHSQKIIENFVLRHLLRVTCEIQNGLHIFYNQCIMFFFLVSKKEIDDSVINYEVSDFKLRL